MFGNTDIRKIEGLLEQVVANQERMLRCWEDKSPRKLHGHDLCLCRTYTSSRRWSNNG